MLTDPTPTAAPTAQSASALDDLTRNGSGTGPGGPGEVPDARWANLAFMRRLAVYLKPYMFRFVLGEVAGLLFAVFNGMIPLVLKVVLDHASSTGGGAHPAKIMPGRENLLGGGFAHFFNVLAEGKYGVIIVCAAIPTVMILRCFFDYINNYMVAWVSLRVLSDIRKQVFEHINRQSLQFFLQNRSGNLISRCVERHPHHPDRARVPRHRISSSNRPRCSSPFPCCFTSTRSSPSARWCCSRFAWCRSSFTASASAKAAGRKRNKAAR